MRYVQFHESVFPFSTLTSKLSSSTSSCELSPLDSPIASRAPVFHRPHNTTAAPSLSHLPGQPGQTTLHMEDHGSSQSSLLSSTSSDLPSLVAESQSPVSQSSTSDSEILPQSATQLAPVQNTHSITTRGKNNIVKPNPKFGLTVILKEIEPANHTRVLKNEKWRKSMSSDYDAHSVQHTWDLVERSQANNIVGCK